MEAISYESSLLDDNTPVVLNDADFRRLCETTGLSWMASDLPGETLPVGPALPAADQTFGTSPAAPVLYVDPRMLTLGWAPQGAAGPAMTTAALPLAQLPPGNGEMVTGRDSALGPLPAAPTVPTAHAGKVVKRRAAGHAGGKRPFKWTKGASEDAMIREIMAYWAENGAPAVPQNLGSRTVPRQVVGSGLEQMARRMAKKALHQVAVRSRKA